MEINLHSRLYFPAVVFVILEGLVLAALVGIGTAFVPLEGNRVFILTGLALIGAAIKTVAWLHAGHFLGQYIPRKTRLGRWSPSVSKA